MNLSFNEARNEHRISNALKSHLAATRLKNKLGLGSEWYVRSTSGKSASGTTHDYFVIQSNSANVSAVTKQIAEFDPKRAETRNDCRKRERAEAKVQSGNALTVGNLPWGKPTKFGSRGSAEHGSRTVVNNARDRQLENEANAWDLVQFEHPNGILEDVSELQGQLGADILVFDEDTDELVAAYDSKSGKYLSASQFKIATKRIQEEGVFTTLISKDYRIVVTPDMPKRVAAWAL